MKKPTLWIACLAVLSIGTSFAQDITGTWQGTLNPGRELRIVFKISKDDGKLQSMLYSIDQPGPGIAASTVTLQGSTVKMVVPGINGHYEGKLSADGNSIAGNWTQGPKPLPLDLTRATKDTAWTIPEPPPPPTPMAADATPAFEVATIKPSNPDRPGKGVAVRGRQFSTLNTSLSDLITFAYGLHARQIVGAPAWIESDKYDLNARPDGQGQPNDKQWKAMVQKLIAERFKLTFRRDKKELSVYAIVVAKTGPKLTKSQADPNGLPALGFRALGALNCRNTSMADFAQLMQGAVLDKPVVDQTGLPGRFDFALNWTPDEFQFSGLGGRVPPPADNVAAPPDLYTAIQQQIGLKLEVTKAQAEVLVIDHVEKPSEN
jgi:uncharacterized protein (TIGR03435 family)